MSLSSSPIDQREWHVLFRGERLGPISRAELRMLLDTHPERWHASVWRPGMLNWRSAESIRALTQGAPMAAPWLVCPGTPLVDPRPASIRAPRDASGQLRVLSYEEREAPVRDPGRAVAPAALAPTPEVTDTAPTTLSRPCLAVSGEWSMVATSELNAIDVSELRAQSALEPGLATSGEWNPVATSELRVLGASELRVLASQESRAPATLHELRAIPKEQLLRDSALPSMIISEPTATNLPSFPAEPGAVAPAPEAATPTPPPLPRRRPVPVPKSRTPLRALPLVLGGLVLLSALALILIRLH